MYKHSWGGVLKSQVPFQTLMLERNWLCIGPHSIVTLWQPTYKSQHALALVPISGFYHMYGYWHGIAQVMVASGIREAPT